MTATWMPEEACAEAREWVGDKTLSEAWAATYRADWMVFLFSYIGADANDAEYAAKNDTGYYDADDAAYWNSCEAAALYPYDHTSGRIAAKAAADSYWRAHPEVADKIRAIATAEQVVEWLGVTP